MKLSRAVQGQRKLHLRISEKACDKRESLFFQKVPSFFLIFSISITFCSALIPDGVYNEEI